MAPQNATNLGMLGHIHTALQPLSTQVLQPARPWASCRAWQSNVMKASLLSKCPSHALQFSVSLNYTGRQWCPPDTLES